MGGKKVAVQHHLPTPPPLAPSHVRTERLVLRCWAPRDAPQLKSAIDRSLDHLQQWMPWAMSEPSAVDVIEARLDRFRDSFLRGHDWPYGIFDAGETEVVGGAGIHPRIGADALEIGYWIRGDCTRRGYATEAATALTRIGFAWHGVNHMEIRCDPRNVRSAAIPRRLGYRHSATLVSDTYTPTGEPRDTMVWTMPVEVWQKSPWRDDLTTDITT
jgi:RimJ/RimL family protein N-acetyltransferase